MKVVLIIILGIIMLALVAGIWSFFSRDVEDEDETLEYKPKKYK